MDCIEPKTPLRPRGGKKSTKANGPPIEQFNELFLSDASEQEGDTIIPLVESRIEEWLIGKGIVVGDPQAKRECFFDERKSFVSDRLSTHAKAQGLDSIRPRVLNSSTCSSEALPSLPFLQVLSTTPTLAGRRELGDIAPLTLFSPQNNVNKAPHACRGRVLPPQLKTVLSHDRKPPQPFDPKPTPFVKILAPNSAPIAFEEELIGENAPRERSRSQSPGTPELHPTRLRRPHSTNDPKFLISTIRKVLEDSQF